MAGPALALLADPGSPDSPWLRRFNRRVCGLRAGARTGRLAVAGECRPDRELVRRLEHAAEEPLEHLWADVTALEWVADVLESAFEKHDKPAGPRRTSTKTDHAEKTEAARAFLASHMSQPVMLTEVAQEVAASPFNFARIFQQQTGLPIHRYLTLLRLRASLELLFDGQDDLTKLALDLGFSSHSHFTNIFRREFGHAPSEVRKNASSSKFRQMSKNLIV